MNADSTQQITHTENTNFTVTSENIKTGEQDYTALVDVPSTTPQPLQRPYQPQLYDYLVLFTGLIAAATPLILGWFQLKKNSKKV
jgi:hypothetical protein